LVFSAGRAQNLEALHSPARARVCSRGIEASLYRSVGPSELIRGSFVPFEGRSGVIGIILSFVWEFLFQIVVEVLIGFGLRSSGRRA